MTSKAGLAKARHSGGLTSPLVKRTQRRILCILAITQLLNGIGVAIGVAVGVLAAAMVSGSEMIGGLAQTASVGGMAIFALPLARIASRFGRRPSLVLGFVSGMCGSSMVAIAVRLDLWQLVLAGMFLFGASSTAGYATRFAATDLAEPSRRGVHIALVVWPATVGVTLGPNLAVPAQRLFMAPGMVHFSGPFILAALMFGLAAILVLSGLRPDPLRLARKLVGETAIGGDGTPTRGQRWLPLAALRRSVHLRAAIYGMAVSHAAMSAIMAMTALHLYRGHASLSMVGVIISAHLLGMYALSPVFGWLVDCYGSARLLTVGLIIMVVSALTAGAGSAQRPSLIAVGLFALGIGWSCSLIAGSALLTQHTDLEVRPSMQGLSDLVMDSSAAAASMIGGIVVAQSSFGVLAAGVSVSVVLLIVAVMRSAWND